MMNFTNNWNQEPAVAPVTTTVYAPVTVNAAAVSTTDAALAVDPTLALAIQNEEDIFSDLLQQMSFQNFLFEDEMRRVATRYTMRSNCQECSNDTALSIIGLNVDDDDEAPTSLPGPSNFSSALGLPVFDMNSLLGFSAS
jgi:hypothetical protein